MAVTVKVKWGKELFEGIQVDLNEPPLVFKAQLFGLSNVPPDRQKIMVKGGLLKDDDWGKQTPKDGQTLMMVGSAGEVVAAPQKALVFLEDLPEHEQETLDTKQYGAGLLNLGNTCYMNSTVQILYSIHPLRDTMLQAQPGLATGSTVIASKLVAATKELFGDLKTGGPPFAPFNFLLALRERFPQFAQQAPDSGAYMQQDAEECFSQILHTLREALKDGQGSSAVEKIFSIGLHTKLKCDESGEEFEESSSAPVLKCNISSEVNHLHQGIKLGLTEDREKTSEKLGRVGLFKGVSEITSLPPYLTVQMVRFLYKAAVQQKAKILRKVQYPALLDLYEFCSDALKQQLDGPRLAYKEAEDKRLAAEKLSKSAKKEGTAGAVGPEPMDITEAVPQTGSQTGFYQLTGVLTHKGRSADSGHYVAWVKQADGKWVLFDDDKLTMKSTEDILALSGGGDWHMAYLLLYEAVLAPPAKE